MRLVIPVTLMRGGTSKGVFIRREDFPDWDDPVRRDNIILALMGSPDPMQIDGLGGTHSSTSKVMVVAPSAKEGFDVEYTFAQVGIDRPIVDFRGNCGNLTSAVAPFAIAEGMIKAVEPVTRAVLWNTNTSKRIVAEIPVQDGVVVEHGDFRIDGVPGTGAPIVTHFYDPAGAATGRLFPTGRTRDILQTSRGTFEVSIIDVTNPVVFVRATDVGIRGDESPSELNANRELLELLEEIRRKAGVLAGIHPDEISASGSNLPVISMVAPPRDYTTVHGQKISGEQIDLLGRMVSLQKVHHAYPGTGAMCTAAAAKLPGTIVYEVARVREDEYVIIGHPKGTIHPGVEVKVREDGLPEVVRVAIVRTARRLLRGEAYIYYSERRSPLEAMVSLSPARSEGGGIHDP